MLAVICPNSSIAQTPPGGYGPSFSGIPKGTGIPITVSTDGTGTFNATGTADQVPIQAAITAASAAGGGTVFIKQGVYHLNACVTPASNVVIYGVQPAFTAFDNVWNNNYWSPLASGGTWLEGDGAEVGFCFANTPSNNQATYLTANALMHAEFHNLGMYNFTRAFDIGSQENAGMYWGVMKNIFVTGCTDWGIHMENFSESYFEQIHSVSNTTGDMWWATTAYYAAGNTEFHQLYSSPASNLARGIVFAAPGIEAGLGGNLGGPRVFNLQVNRYRDSLTTQTITPSNGSTAISVTDLTKFKVLMPFWVTTTADGFTQNQMYFVLSVSGSSGAGTITAGNAPSTAAITANAGTALTLNSYGYAAVEVVGNQLSTPASLVVSPLLYGLDLENSSISMGILADRASAGFLFELQNTGIINGPALIVLRNSSGQIISTTGASYDFDATSGSVIWNGQRGAVVQRQTQGIYRSNATQSWAVGLDNNGGDNPSFYSRSGFIYPTQGFGRLVQAQDISQTLTGAHCGAVRTFNGAAGQTFTLPVVDNGGVKASSLQGCVYIISNTSANTLTITTQSSQTFNNVTGLTSIILPPKSVVDLTASFNNGGLLYWAANFGNVSPSGGLVAGAYNCVNVTPVTTTGGAVATDQNTLACTIPANTLNLVGKTLNIKYNGLYTTNTANLSTINLKVKICSVSGCASGNVITLANITSAANAGGVTGFAMGYVGDATTQTAGAALAEESHGLYTLDIAATNVLPETAYRDTNTTTVVGVPSNIDSTAQNFLQVSCAFSIADALNTCQGRQLIVESIQ